MAGGGGSVLIKIEGGGWVIRGGGVGVARAAGECLWGGLGANFLFRGRNSHEVRNWMILQIFTNCLDLWHFSPPYLRVGGFGGGSGSRIGT